VDFHSPTKIRIEFDKPKTLEDTIQKAKCCYDQSKHKKEPSKDWKRKDKSGFQKKGFKSFSYKNSKERCTVLVNQAEVCINKIFHLKVEINQQRKQEKEQRNPRKDLCNVGDVENHTY
jgi:hypothetical protein